MKWCVPKQPELGETRIRRRFAWLPIFIQDTRKQVWLEWVTVEEKYSIIGVSQLRYGWRVIREVAA